MKLILSKCYFLSGNAFPKTNFPTEPKRMEFLFELYEKYTADLFSKEKSKEIKIVEKQKQ